MYTSGTKGVKPEGDLSKNFKKTQPAISSFATANTRNS